jgi:hypothetical protein
MVSGHFTACASFDKNTFQVEIMDRLIFFFFLNDRSKLSSGFLHVNIHILAQSSYHRNSHIDGVLMR